uniref:RRM domain-containing protein n=1 Tax=Ditylenchus dipsaci TaxID=166011 RepID=A0A915EQ56_9BILA
MGSRREQGPPAINGLHSLKVDNLSYNTSVHELKRMFERYGEIGDVHIPKDRRTNQSRGFGFVRFYDLKDAEYAVSRMDGRRTDGRELRVNMAKYDRPIDESRPGDRRGRNRSRSRSRTRSPPSRGSHRRSNRSRSPPAAPSSRGRDRSDSPPARRSSRSNSRSRSRSPYD